MSNQLGWVTSEEVAASVLMTFFASSAIQATHDLKRSSVRPFKERNEQFSSDNKLFCLSLLFCSEDSDDDDEEEEPFAAASTKAASKKGLAHVLPFLFVTVTVVDVSR